MPQPSTNQDDQRSVTSNSSNPPPPPKHAWFHKWIQKLSQILQTEENKKMMQVFLIDPILNHILDRIFPYVLILCVLFVVLTIMISLTLLIVFTRVPAAFSAVTTSS
jgi:hypothetical protein